MEQPCRLRVRQTGEVLVQLAAVEVESGVHDLLQVPASHLGQPPPAHGAHLAQVQYVMFETERLPMATTALTPSLDAPQRRGKRRDHVAVGPEEGVRDGLGALANGH